MAVSLGRKKSESPGDLLFFYPGKIPALSVAGFQSIKNIGKCRYE
jgi:hypothetical protein